MSVPEALATVVATGDARRSLEALRDRLARQIDGSDSGRDVASLAARLTDVLEKIAALPAPAEGTALDELAARRVDAGRVTARPARARRG